MSKLAWANEAKGLAAQMAQLVDKARDLHAVYFDRGYNTGGANEIVDADIEVTGNTASEIAGFVTMAEQMEKWVHGNHTAPADGSLAALDHDQTLNKLRSDI